MAGEEKAREHACMNQTSRLAFSSKNTRVPVVWLILYAVATRILAQLMVVNQDGLPLYNDLMNFPARVTEYLLECDARVIAAVPNATIARERSYPRYLIVPSDSQNRSKLEDIGVEVATTELSDPIVIHSPFLF